MAGENQKGVGTLGSIALLVMSMTGPGLPMIPPLYQQAGWLAPTVVLLVIAYLSGVASLFICEVLSSIRGNEKFQAQIEFTTVAQLLLGKRYHYFFQIILYIALQAVIIASIVISAQTMDNLIITLFKGTCGLNIYPGGWVCVSQGNSSTASPFNEDDYFIFTFGFLLTMAMVMPLGFFDLVDNMGVMITSLLIMTVVTIQWVVAFCQEGLVTERLPVTGPSSGMVMGIIIFNFSYVTTVPTWVNSINPDVCIHSCITWSIIITALIYILLGVFGAMAFPMTMSDNVLTLLANESTVASKVTTYLFPIAALISSIPVFVIVIRCNLLRGDLCGKRWATFWSNILPWIICIPLMNKDWMNTIQNWISLFFQSSTNYIIPFVLYFVSRKFQGSVIEEDSTEKVPEEPTDVTMHHLEESAIRGRTSEIRRVSRISRQSAIYSSTPRSILRSPLSPRSQLSPRSPRSRYEASPAPPIILEEPPPSLLVVNPPPLPNGAFIPNSPSSQRPPSIQGSPNNALTVPPPIESSPRSTLATTAVGSAQGLGITPSSQNKEEDQSPRGSLWINSNLSLRNPPIASSVIVDGGSDVKNHSDIKVSIQCEQQEEQQVIGEDRVYFMAFKPRPWLNPFFVAVIACSLLTIGVIFMVIYNITMAALGNDMLS